jgi:hypothetical protein
MQSQMFDRMVRERGEQCGLSEIQAQGAGGAAAADFGDLGREDVEDAGFVTAVLQGAADVAGVDTPGVPV